MTVAHPDRERRSVVGVPVVSPATAVIGSRAGVTIVGPAGVVAGSVPAVVAGLVPGKQMNCTN